MKEKILTVTIKDCEVQTFRVGGAGGQKRDKTSSGVRVIHHPSGARAESRESRSQAANKREAFIKMSDTPEFKYWVAVMTRRIESDEAYLDRQMDPKNIKLEVKEDGKWVEADEGLEQAGVSE